jgi:hypothetical protein
VTIGTSSNWMKSSKRIFPPVNSAILSRFICDIRYRLDVDSVVDILKCDEEVVGTRRKTR